jgi:Trk K+ transport system NAD-binding subunit
MSRLLVFGTTPLAQEIGELAQELSLDAGLVSPAPAEGSLGTVWERLSRFELPVGDDGFRTLLQDCDCAILTAKDDAGNLDLAFRLHEIRPALRIVVALRHRNMAREIERLVVDASGWCCALHPEEVAAPAFALAALQENVAAAFEHENQFYALVRGRREGGTELSSGETLVQARRLSELETSRDQMQEAAENLLSQARTRPDIFLSAIAALVVSLLVGATVFFHHHEHLPWFSSFYFVVTTFCTVGYGDISLKDSDILSKTVGIALMFSSMFLTASLFAILTNALVQMRLDRLEGRRRFRLRQHVIVCGLGTLGLQVVHILRHLRVRTLAIEADRDKVSSEELGHIQVEAMIADATKESVLERACLRRARSLVSTIDGDLVSLEIAVSSRLMRPSLRAIARIQGDDFARRLQRNLRIQEPLSVPSLAAPFFLAQALHPRARTLLRVGGALHAVVAAPKSGGIPGRPLTDGKEPLGLVLASQLDDA